MIGEKEKSAWRLLAVARAAIPALTAARAAVLALAALVGGGPVLAVPSPASAAETGAPALPPGFETGTGGEVAVVVDGDTVALADGTEIRLTGLQAPKLALGRAGFVEWPLAEEARAALSALVQGRRVTLAYGGRRVDRYGRQLAQLVRDDGLWVQGAMIHDGWARVYGFEDNRTGLPELLALEQAARDGRRGIWADGFYAVRDQADAGAFVDGFELVEGKVLDAAEVRGRVYLNFGPDRRTDFTASIAREDRASFDGAGLDPLDLEGRRVRVRGWIRDFDGPRIDVTHPEQIELLDGGAAPPG